MVDNHSTPTNNISLQRSQRFDIIGKVLVDMGKLSPESLAKILSLQNKEGLKFGDAAKKLGLLNNADIQHALALQFEYPYLAENQTVFSKELVAAYLPYSPQVEALRALRSQLILRWFSEGHKALSIISATEGAGSSYMAANLAVVFSQLGQKTLLIDANLRSPRQQEIFKLSMKHGLSDVLIGRADLDIALTKIDALLDLTVLSSGTTPPNPQELLNNSRFTLLMNQLSESFDVIIVDTSSTQFCSDAQPVALRCQGALLVSKKDVTEVVHIENLRDQLNFASVRIVGAVLNEF
jgi:protein-tyrosine kinase